LKYLRDWYFHDAIAGGQKLMSGRPGFHEDFSRAEHVDGSSDRGFGITFAVVFGLLAAWKWWTASSLWPWCLGIALVFGAIALTFPALLAPLNRLWFKLGLFLFKFVSPVMMGLLFITTIVPIGLLMRAFGKDPLRLAFDKKATSYWIVRTPPGPPPAGMKNQF
jgi:hypothetical protein